MNVIHLDDALLSAGGVVPDDRDATPEMGRIVSAAERVVDGDGTHILDARDRSCSNIWRFDDGNVLVRVEHQVNVLDSRRRVELAIADEEGDVVARLAVQDHRDPISGMTRLRQDTLDIARHGLAAAHAYARGCDPVLHDQIRAVSESAMRDWASRIDAEEPVTASKGVHRIGTPWRDAHALLDPLRSDKRTFGMDPCGFPSVVGVTLNRWFDPVPCATLRISGIEFTHADIHVAPDPMAHMRNLSALAALLGSAP